MTAEELVIRYDYGERNFAGVGVGASLELLPGNRLKVLLYKGLIGDGGG